MTRWAVVAAALAVALLALPLLLFTWLSYVRLGEMSFSYYVPYEELRQGLATGQLRAIYFAPLVAVNVTSGFIIANMFTYTLGHTVMTLVLVTLLLACLARARRRARARGGRVSPGAVAAAVAGLVAVTAASSSAALTGCHGAGMGGGIIALVGLGSTTGAWLSDAATLAQLLLVANLGLALLVLSSRDERPPQREPHGRAAGGPHA